MPPNYEKQLLEKIVNLSEENNKILKHLRGNARWGTFFGFVKWAIILGPLIWVYIFFKPYIGTFQDLINKLPEQIQTLQNVGKQIDGAKNLFQTPVKPSN